MRMTSLNSRQRKLGRKHRLLVSLKPLARRERWNRYKRAAMSTKKKQSSMSKIPAQYSGPSDSEAGTTFIVEEFEDVKVLKNGDRMYFVKWLGYPGIKNTWEPEKELPAKMVKMFNKRHKSRGPRPEPLPLDWKAVSIVDIIQHPISTKPLDENDCFPRGWIAEKVERIDRDTGTVTVRFKGKNRFGSASFEYCRRNITELLIDFYMAHNPGENLVDCGTVSF